MSNVNVNRGGMSSAGQARQYIGTLGSGIDGSKVVTFPTFEPLFTGRNKVIQVEAATINPGAHYLGALTFPAPASMGANFQNNYQLLLDNVARAYANAQGLGLTTIADVITFSINWMQAYATLMPLVSILNGDGFNEVITKMAQTLTTFRSRIQTQYDRLQTVPVPPGFIDLVDRCFGVFASDSGDDCYINLFNLTAVGAPTDLYTTANINTLLNNVDTALANLIGGTIIESGTIRIVFAEYYGAPAELSYPGVKISRALYEQFRVMALWNVAGANIFTAPPLQTGVVTAGSGQTVALLVPQGYEDDPWWFQLSRWAPFGATNNILVANTGGFGLAFPLISVSTTIRGYPQGGAVSTAFVAAGALNGYTSPLNELYYAPPVAAADVNPYANDGRNQNSFTVFNVNFDYLANETMQMQNRILVGKQRIPQCKDLQMYSTERVRSRL